MVPGWQELLILLVIVALIFGTKKLKNIGSDLGGAVKGFKDSLNDEDKNASLTDAKSESATTSSEETESVGSK